MRIFLLLLLLCTVLTLEAKAQNWNFERGDLMGWTPRALVVPARASDGTECPGRAFDNQPTYGDNVAARLPGTRSGHEGNYWVSTYESRHTPADREGGIQGDGPTGTLTSSEFTITNQISFLIGGGNDFTRLRVELLVKIAPGDELPPAIVGFLGIGERVTLPDGDYFVGTYSTGRNSESMRREVWDLSSPVPGRPGPYYGRHGRIRIKDASCRPWGHISADDFQVGDAASHEGRIHVTQTGANIEGAEVYINGNRAGATDASGNLAVGPLSTADNIIARKLVFEHQSNRPNHSSGSTQNWNFRVYVTSMAVNNNATTSPAPVMNPAVTQEIQLNNNNTIVGLHLVASLEWDATPNELFDWRDNIFNPASEFLYNATDGQFFIEQMEIVDDAGLWDDTDYQIQAGLTRSNTDPGRFDGPCFLCGNGWMRMRRTADGAVYIHEFGHYGFDLWDEYADNQPAVHCTRSVRQDDGSSSPVVDYGSNAPKASCLMWTQAVAGKFCSDREENPHVRGTGQGDTSCWTRIGEKFRDTQSVARWNVQTPDTRRAIVGRLPSLPSGWMPRVTIDNRSRAGLCRPYDVTVRNSLTGQLWSGAYVWNQTFYGQNIYAGQTNEAGRISVIGVHIGDRISTGSLSFVVNSCDRVTAERRTGDDQLNGSQLAWLRPVSFNADSLRSVSMFGPFTGIQQNESRVLQVAPPAFDLQISLEPTAVAGQALIRARSSVELAAPPQITFSLTGSTGKQPVAMSFEAATNTYVGIVSQLPLDTRGAVEATAIDRAGRSVMRIVSVSLSPIAPNVATNLFSSDGQLSLTIPAGALAGGARVAIGSNAPTPVIDTGTEIVSGPFNVLSSTGSRLSRPAVLRFQLTPPSEKGSEISRFDPKSFEVLHYDAASARWEKAGGTFLKDVAVITTPIRELGAYLLIARPRTAPTSAQEFKVVSTALLASPAKYQGSCPAVISFDGLIETSGGGTVEYVFVRNDGATSAVRTLTFKSAGKLPVRTTWSLGAATLPSYSGWQMVKVLSPNVVESDKASFEVQCLK